MGGLDLNTIGHFNCAGNSSWGFFQNPVSEGSSWHSDFDPESPNRKGAAFSTYSPYQTNRSLSPDHWGEPDNTEFPLVRTDCSYSDPLGDYENYLDDKWLNKLIYNYDNTLIKAESLSTNFIESNFCETKR